ncbi:noggin-like [Stegodyphus dumicola]|uniref:noggin-like n=1 Tax=Stegodyphus dumicola TaxID=202533 RepID=UPI0015B35EEE|nr:noggin-like [Stegodyphus dumicola]
MTITEYLYDLIGDDFQSEWMSTKKPKKPWKQVALSEVSLNVSEEVLAFRKHLTLFDGFNFTRELAYLQPDLLPYENKIKSWLIQRSSCPVAFKWKSLGPTYWPQWFRFGYCLNRSGKCSLPFGCMKCKPEGVIHLYFLHMRCTKPIRKEDRSLIYELRKKESKSEHTSSKSKERCQWEKILIPVTVACSCSC